jgi:hypothetical protein
MHPLPRDEFLAWAEAQGAGPDDRYEEPRCLAFKPFRNIGRFWVVPQHPGTWPHFIASWLDGLEPWGSAYLWFRGGRWPGPAAPAPYDTDKGIRETILRGAEIPIGFDGAVRFERQERDRMIAVIFAQIAFGETTVDDLFVVPEHTRTILWVDHHEVVHAEFARRGLVKPFVEHMQAKGYSLPSAAPDWTFKPQRWMKRTRVQAKP